MDEAVKQAFTDAWNLYKRHSNIELAETDEYWDSLLKMERELKQKSANPEFLKDLIRAIHADIERKMKQVREEKEKQQMSAEGRNI